MSELAKVFDESMFESFPDSEPWGSDETWEDGVAAQNELPVYRILGENTTVMVDADGAAVGSEYYFDALLLNIKFPNQLCALAFLNGLPEDFEPLDYGFQAPNPSSLTPND